MLALKYDPIRQTADLVFNGQTLELDRGLETMVFIHLFTHRRARPGERGYEKGVSNRGYWYETYRTNDELEVGTLLWTLKGSPLTQETVLDGKRFAEEGLRIFTRNKIAEKTEVDVFGNYDLERLEIKTTLHRPYGKIPVWSKTWNYTLQ